MDWLQLCVRVNAPERLTFSESCSRRLIWQILLLLKFASSHLILRRKVGPGATDSYCRSRKIRRCFRCLALLTVETVSQPSRCLICRVALLCTRDKDPDFRFTILVKL